MTERSALRCAFWFRFINMRALALVTRYREGAFEADYCLLAYDEPELSGAMVSADVRDVLDRRPNTAWIYVVAPFLPSAAVVEAVLGGSAQDRAGDAIRAVVVRRNRDQLVLLQIDGGTGSSDARNEQPLPTDLVDGWLFNLFDSRRARVDAPAGVHFAKGSGKHSVKFLRTSNVLLSTAACGVVAMFALVKLPIREIRRIFVDTAPLLSVALSMQRIALSNEIWTHEPPALSFSSYGGLDNLPSLGARDLALVSASTSGSLASELVALGLDRDLVLTMFFLRAEGTNTTPQGVVCDLTFAPGRPFGYPPMENLKQDSCRWCKRGFLLAQLEGDQFMLEKRGVKLLRASVASQKSNARDLLETLARKQIVSIDIYRRDLVKTNFILNVERALEDPLIAAPAIRLLKRFTPSPLQRILLVGISPAAFQRLIAEAGMAAQFEHVRTFQPDDLDGMPPVENGGILVLVGCLSDHALLRGISAKLRTKARDGVVAYLSVFTFADSNKNLADLRTFLGYGEHGAETFIFRSAHLLMLPWLQDVPTAWEDELELLRRIQSEASLDPQLLQRLAWLESASKGDDRLLLSGKQGELQIAPDFVYLNTNAKRELISQADVLVVVANLLATVRCENVGLNATSTQANADAIQWNQSVYGQILVLPAALDPRNLRDYNDAILRAAFLRTAFKAELNFSVDEEISSDVLDVLLVELGDWPRDLGDALPEILMSVACGRLRLHPTHMTRFKDAAMQSTIEPHLKQLAGAIRLN